MRLTHNMFSLSIYKTYKDRITDNAKALNNISTGQKLNSAKDNPNKIGKSESLKIKLLASDAASKNIQDTNSMIQTFDGSLQEINDNLARMKELTVSAGGGSLTHQDKKIIQSEIDSIKANINELANNTEFNGVKLSDSSGVGLAGVPTKTIKNAIGTMSDENMDIPFFNVSADKLGIATLDINDIGASLDSVDKATQIISKVRSTYGSIQKRLEGTADYLNSKDMSIQKAQSSIGDADIAEEMIRYSKSQILIQSSIGLMAQSNNFPKDALNILANVR